MPNWRVSHRPHVWGAWARAPGRVRRQSTAAKIEANGELKDVGVCYRLTCDELTTACR
jgi:hypothetical protein